jgi:CBS domain-containing protein
MVLRDPPEGSLSTPAPLRARCALALRFPCSLATVYNPRFMSTARVRDIMREKVVTIAASDTLSTAEDIMRLGGVRHLPVVRGGRLVGVISERDLLRVSLSNLNESGMDERRAFLYSLEVERAMSKPPIVVEPSAPVARAALLMAEHKIGCLPVVEREELIGLVTSTDVLFHFAAG